jgi:hypothetical protein
MMGRAVLHATSSQPNTLLVASAESVILVVPSVSNFQNFMALSDATQRPLVASFGCAAPQWFQGNPPPLELKPLLGVPRVVTRGPSWYTYLALVNQLDCLRPVQ